MKPRLFLLTTSLCAMFSTFAQTTLKGVLVDSLNNVPIPFATVTLSKMPLQKDAKPLRVFVTDAEGAFTEKTSVAGNLMLTFTSVGNKPVSKQFVTRDGINTIDLGNIYTSESVENISGVTVVAQKPLIKSDIDKIAYDVANDPDAEVKTVLDMLRKVPLVTVDGEDNISLNGSSNFIVQMNGRPSSMISKEPGKVFKSMPATMVKNIEVITNPGAKYDAEGIGGIINIVMKRGSDIDGYTATVNVAAGIPNQYMAGASALVKAGKLSLSARFSHFNSQTENEKMTNTTDYLLLNSRLEANAKYDRDQNWNSGSVEASYELDSLNLFTLAAEGNWGNSEQSTDNLWTDFLENNISKYSYNTRNSTKNNYGGLNMQLNYQRLLSAPGQTITASYKFEFDPSGGKTNLKTYNSTGTDDYMSKGDNDASLKEHAFQFDFVSPLGQKHNIEAGAKYTFRDNESNSTFDRRASEADIWMRQDDNSVDMLHHQHIIAAYSTYSFRSGAFGTKVGLRMEESILDVNIKSLNYKFDSDEFKLVPSFAVNYQITPMKSVKFNYNMRIQRPGISYLNPYKNEVDQHSITYGNSSLKAETYHNVTLSFSSFAQKVMFNLDLNYQYCDNAILQYSFANGNRQETTYGNIGSRNKIGLSMFGNFTFSPKTSLWLNGRVNYLDLQSDKIDASASDFDYSIFGGIQQQLPWQLKLGAWGGYMQQEITIQSKMSPIGFYGFNLNRSFVKDRLTLAIDVQSPFNKTLKIEHELNSKDLHTQMNYNPIISGVRFSVSYRFGELKAAVKKVAKSIDSDDLKNEKSNTSGNSGVGAVGM